MRGMLMFAHNNDLFDYGKMAYASALSAVHYIEEPISLVTDDGTWSELVNSYPDAERLFGDPILIEHEKRNERHFDLEDGTRKQALYHNLTRLRAYELSPYDETLLLDTDVLVQDSALRNVWNSTAIVRMNCNISNLVKKNPPDRIVKIGNHGLTSLWATICYFRRCDAAKEFFNIAEYVAQNYNYYGALHQFSTGLLRVDYVMTIAAHIMSGYVPGSESVVTPLPGDDTVFAWNKDILVDVEKGRATFLADVEGRKFPVSTYRTVHCMNKDSMMNMADRIIDQYA